MKGYGLLFEMGVGKSLTAIAIMGALYQAGEVRRVLVVAPSSVCSVWEREMARFADFPHKTAMLLGEKKKRLEALAALDDGGEELKLAAINYESTFRDGIREALETYNADLIIADESQRIKTHSAAQSKAMHRLGDRAKYKLILTGTPVQNSAVDLYSQYRFLDPTIYGTNFYAFRNRYVVMGGYGNYQIIGYKNMDDLIRRAHSIAYRVTKSEALDLPAETSEDRYVVMPPSVRKTYDQLRRDSYAEIEARGTITAATVLTKLLRLQQFTGGFLQLDEGARPTPVHTAKLDALADIIDDYVIDEGKKLVVFARFRPEIAAIEKLLQGRGVRYGTIHGDVPGDARGSIVDDFQDNPETMVFLAQIQTAGVGISLFAASTAVFYSLGYNYADYSQAMARIHRNGQRHPVTYIHLLAEDSVDIKTMQALACKEDLSKSITDNWREYFR